MMNVSRSSAAALLAATLFAGGCAQKVQAPPPPPSAKLRAELGRIGAISHHFSRMIVLETPAKGAGEGALAGAGQGALATIGAMAGSASHGEPVANSFFGLVVGVALAPVGAAVGAIVGASNAHSEAEVVAAETALRKVLAGTQPGHALRDRIVAATRRDTQVDIVALPDFDHRLGHRALAGKKDSVLAISIERFGFEARGKISPDLRLHIRATAQLVRVSDGQALYRRSWAHVGPWRNYFDWARNDAALLHSSLDTAFDGMARSMVSVLFVETAAPELGAPRGRGATAPSRKGSPRCPNGVVISYC